VLATLASERSDSALAQGESAASALNSGYHLAYLVGAALIGVALVVALRVFRTEPEAATETEAPRATEVAFPEAA
jgi:hypothetical protein